MDAANDSLLQFLGSKPMQDNYENYDGLNFEFGDKNSEEIKWEGGFFEKIPEANVF